MSRNGQSKNGCVRVRRSDWANLKASISLAKGLLAILSSGQISRLIKKSGETSQEPVHTRILLQDLMDEVWKMETLITTSESTSLELSGKH